MLCLNKWPMVNKQFHNLWTKLCTRYTDLSEEVWSVADSGPDFILLIPHAGVRYLVHILLQIGCCLGNLLGIGLWFQVDPQIQCMSFTLRPNLYIDQVIFSFKCVPGIILIILKMGVIPASTNQKFHSLISVATTQVMLTSIYSAATPVRWRQIHIH